MHLQQTLAGELTIKGQALHSGVTITMQILPQPAGTGINFGRSDLKGQPQIKADIAGVIDTQKNLMLGKDDWQIGTIEHLMAVFHSLRIDNALVLVDGAELPMGDGSGKYFAEEIKRVGLITQDQPRQYTVIKEPIWVEGEVRKNGEPEKALLIALPSDDFEISYTFTSDHPVTGTQYYHFNVTRGDFLREIAPARTIAFLREIKYLQSQGRALGGNIDYAVIVGDDQYLNELRFPDEIVRHKILDILGDLYLAGPLQGHIIGLRSGHALDLELAKKISKLA